MSEYKVRFYMDGLYEVVRRDYVSDYEDKETVVFQGSLSDCEAYIRLKKDGYM
jgi:hypothetical protein